MNTYYIILTISIITIYLVTRKKKENFSKVECKDSNEINKQDEVIEFDYSSSNNDNVGNFKSDKLFVKSEYMSINTDAQELFDSRYLGENLDYDYPKSKPDSLFNINNPNLNATEKIIKDKLKNNGVFNPNKEYDHDSTFRYLGWGGLCKDKYRGNCAKHVISEPVDVDKTALNELRHRMKHMVDDGVFIDYEYIDEITDRDNDAYKYSTYKEVEDNIKNIRLNNLQEGQTLNQVYNDAIFKVE